MGCIFVYVKCYYFYLCSLIVVVLSIYLLNNYIMILYYKSYFLNFLNVLKFVLRRNVWKVSLKILKMFLFNIDLLLIWYLYVLNINI